LRLMSMETMFLAMYDAPDNLHALMSMLRDNALRMSKWAEEEGILVLNNGNQCTCGTCYNFTTLLPGDDYDPKHVKLKNMWGVMDSQETVGVSPDLFHEFCFPYYRDLGSGFWEGEVRIGGKTYNGYLLGLLLAVRPEDLPPGVVVGRVFGDLNGDGQPEPSEALEGVRVKALGLCGASSLAFSRADGSFALKGVRSCYTFLSLSKEGFLPRLFPLRGISSPILLSVQD